MHLVSLLGIISLFGVCVWGGDFYSLSDALRVRKGGGKVKNVRRQLSFLSQFCFGGLMTTSGVLGGVGVNCWLCKDSNQFCMQPCYLTDSRLPRR